MDEESTNKKKAWEFLDVEQICPHEHEISTVPHVACDLNSEQLNALKSIVDGSKCKNKHMDAVLGAPGTGKTKLVTTLLLAIGEMRTVTLCLPSALSAEELIGVMQESCNLTLGFDKLENLLLFATKSETPTKMQKFNIENIVDQYATALLFGKQFVILAIQSLRRYSSLFDYHVAINPKLHFLEFFRTKISAAFKDLKEYLDFILRLPPSSFCCIDAEEIVELIRHLEDFNTCLNEEVVEEDSLKYILNVSRAPMNKSVLCIAGLAVAKRINVKRVECLVALERIIGSLILEKFTTKGSIVEYLMKKSKLLICTSTCSYLKSILCGSHKKPSDLLIVDNATNMQEQDLANIIEFSDAENMVIVADDCLLQRKEASMKAVENILLKKSTSFYLKTHFLVQQYRIHPPKDQFLTIAKLQSSQAEFSWIGISEDLLSPIRNQGAAETCAFQSSLAATETHYRQEARLDDPPREFTIILCLEDMEEQYAKFIGSKLGFEKTGGENKRNRLENALLVLKERGVLGSSRGKKVPIAFKISSFEKYTTSDLTIVHKLLQDEKVMPGHFRLSRNYFSLRSGQAYKYDPKQPIINPNNKLLRSHAVMFVGFLPPELAKKEKATECEGRGKEKIVTELVYQNSYGQLFGEKNGFGIIQDSSVKGFFLPML